VVGRVGCDVAGAALRRALETRGVEPLLVADPEAPTGLVLLLGDQVVTERGANARLVAGDLPQKIHVAAVLVSGYALLHDDTQAAAEAALARTTGPWIAVDAASARLVERYGAERFFAATRRATALFANEAEARALTGLDGVDGARALAERYRLVCVTRGAAGAVAVAEGRVEEARAAHAMSSSDEVTGAGDAFAGTLLAALVLGENVGSALERACAAGAASLASPDGWPGASAV
jgi:sugar/nucleoside kinase (ribokinase family)